jgi:hypothetical protein
MVHLILPAAFFALAAALFPLELEYDRAIGAVPDGRKKLMAPVSMALGPDSSLFVVDGPQNRVVKFSLSGGLLAEGGGGAGADRLSNPSGITRRMGFSLFVCDAENGRLVQMDEALGVVSAFSLSDGDRDGIFRPDGITAGPEGLLYIFDNSDGAVLCLEPGGRLFPFFRDQGEGGARTLRPTAAAVLDRKLFFSDEKGRIILCYDRFGNFLRSFGKGIEVPFSGLAASGDSLLLASDAKSGAIRVFSPDGREGPALKAGVPEIPFSPGALLMGRGLFFAVNTAGKNVAVFIVR